MQSWELARFMQTVKTGVVYFALVFAAGFVLGTIRTLWVAPSFGARNAELMETPIMVAVSLLAARWVAGHLSLPSAPTARLSTGAVALALMVGAEFMVVVWTRSMTIGEYF